MYADQPTGRFFSLRTVNLTRVSKLLAKLSSAVSFHCILASPAGFSAGRRAIQAVRPLARRFQCCLGANCNMNPLPSHVGIQPHFPVKPQHQPAHKDPPKHDVR